jgi:transposase
MCRLLVGLGDITVLAVAERWLNLPLEVHVRRDHNDGSCPGCGEAGQLIDIRRVRHVDLPCFGRRTILVWHKRRWSCPTGCGIWTERDPTIAAERHVLTDRAGRWATLQVGMNGRSVSEVAAELGCSWHTVNNAVIAYGTPLVDHPDRIGQVTALGLDEVGFARIGRIRLWSTSIVDVQAGRMLDVVEGRDALPAIKWLAARDPAWRAMVRWATLDLAGTYRKVFDTMLPGAVQVADPFHVVKLANAMVDDVRRRVQQETTGHRGRKADPLYRLRRRLTIAAEKLDDTATEPVVGLLAAGDPHGEVTAAWQGN